MRAARDNGRESMDVERVPAPNRVGFRQPLAPSRQAA